MVLNYCYVDMFNTGFCFLCESDVFGCVSACYNLCCKIVFVSYLLLVVVVM